MLFHDFLLKTDNTDKVDIACHQYMQNRYKIQHQCWWRMLETVNVKPPILYTKL